MPLPKSVCLEHLMWNCRFCSQKNQQQAQTATSSVENAPTQARSTSVSTKTIPPAPGKRDKPTPPVAASTSTAENSLPVTAASSSSGNETVQQGQKRKESESTSTLASSFSSKPDKRLKMSKRITCEVALKVLRGINFLDKRFVNSGKVHAWALEPDHPDFIRIHDYFALTQHPEEKPMKILSILRIITAAHKLEDDAPLDFSDYPDASGMYRMMLWYGTPTRNVSSILENGFLQAYPSIVTFTDMVALCRGLLLLRRGYIPYFAGYLFLCDVLLWCKRGWKEPNFGNIHCHSMFPRYDRLEERMDKEIDGCIWPLAGGAERAKQFFWRTYNEFVVFNPAQIHPKYLIKVEF